LGDGYLDVVMAGLVPAIHVLGRQREHVDARDRPGHDALVAAARSNFD